MTTLTNVTLENEDKDSTWSESTLTWASTRTWADFTELTSITAI